MSVPAVSTIRPNFSYKPAANTFGPCPYGEAFDSVVALLGVGEIGRVGAVCQVWLNRVDTCVWKKLFEVYGIPQVVGGPRDYKADFKWLYPITVSGHKIAKYFGKVVGSVPPVKQAELDKFKGRDFRVVVVPKMIIRTINEKMTPLTLNAAGRIIDPPLRLEGEEEYLIRPIFYLRTVKEGNCKIPFSLKNLMVLANRKENKMRPFSRLCWRPAVTQFDSVALKNDVHLMEYHSAEESEGLDFEEQEALVEGEGFQVTPLMPRVLFDAVEVFETRTYPDRYVTVKFSDVFCENGVSQKHAIIDSDDNDRLRIDGDSFDYGYDDRVVRGWRCSQ